MRKALIVIQAEQISDAKIEHLDTLIQKHYREHVGSEKLLTIWNTLPKGQAFTDYEDSRSSMITVECPNDFPQESRVAMLTSLERDWRTVTGQNPHQVMLALVEETLFADVFSSNKQRLSPIGRLCLVLKVLSSFVRARLTGSPISFNPNL